MLSLKVIKPLDLKKRLAVIARGDFRLFLNPAGALVRNDIIANIKKQRTPSGGALKENAPSTKKRKMQILGHSLSLIWNRVLIKPSTWIIKAKKKIVLIRLSPERKKIGKILERKGYHFFGISSWVRQVIFARWRQQITRGLR